MTHEEYLDTAVRLAMESAASGTGGPFGAVVVRDGRIIGTGTNRVTSGLDPSAHAEVMAIREACRNIQDFRLDGSILYASCMPCAMCYAAVFWARIEQVYFAARAEDAAAAGFDDLRVAAALAAPVAPKPMPSATIKVRNRRRIGSPIASCPHFPGYECSNPRVCSSRPNGVVNSAATGAAASPCAAARQFPCILWRLS